VKDSVFRSFQGVRERKSYREPCSRFYKVKATKDQKLLMQPYLSKFNGMRTVVDKEEILIELGNVERLGFVLAGRRRRRRATNVHRI